MVGTNSKIDICDFIYCSDISSTYIGDIDDENNINSIGYYDVFGGVNFVFDSEEIEKVQSSQNILNSDFKDFDTSLIIGDMYEGKYIEEALSLCNYCCTASKPRLVIFCPVIAHDQLIKFFQEILPKAINYDNIVIKPIINYFKHDSNSVFDQYMATLSHYYDDEDAAKVNDFINIFQVQLSPVKYDSNICRLQFHIQQESSGEI